MFCQDMGSPSVCQWGVKFLNSLKRLFNCSSLFCRQRCDCSGCWAAVPEGGVSFAPPGSLRQVPAIHQYLCSSSFIFHESKDPCLVKGDQSTCTLYNPFLRLPCFRPGSTVLNLDQLIKLFLRKSYV
jgi:hypothetical protein